jgi:hypothetical protein
MITRITRRATFARQLRLPGVALAYAAVVVVIANVAFGMADIFTPGEVSPARTGLYDSRIPIVSPVDPGTIAKAITEATGGEPTIGLPLPVTVVAINRKVAAPAVAAAAPITPATTPTYTAVTRVQTLTLTSLLSLIPTNLRFPPRAKPHRR